ncbi:MAG: hypothetical protein FJ278_08925, partial [Planctomycetes bacterium]|nr:hypothetical protein [Planctomycetota bacterium]
MPDANQPERGSGKRERRPGKPGADPKLTRGLLLWVMLILSVLLFTSYRRPWGSSPRLIDMGRFDEHLSRGEIGKAWLTDNELKGTLAKPVADYTRFTVVFPPDYLDRQKVDEIRAKV